MALFANIPVPYQLPRMYPPTMNGGPDGQIATMTFDIGLNDLSTFVNFLAGTVEVVNIPGGGTMNVIVPLQHPDNPLLYVIGYGSEAFGSPNNPWPLDANNNPYGSIYTPMYSHYRVRVDFATMPYLVAPDVPLYSLTTDHAVTMETLPFGGFVFPNGYRPTGEYAIRVGSTSYSLTVYQSTAPVSEFVDNLIGKVNSVPFVTADRTFPANSIRIDGVRSEFAKGLYSTTIVKGFALKYRERSWQMALDNTGTWAIPTFQGTSLMKYESADLNLIKYA